MFITHSHTDHILGAIWIYRMIATNINNQKYQGQFHIYGNDHVINTIQTMVTMMLPKKLVDLMNQTIILHTVKDQEKVEILESEIQFFDICSTKIKQFGFTMKFNGKRLTCLGDEPMHESSLTYVSNVDYLLVEAFCLYEERALFDPYSKNHTTVKEPCLLAQKENVKNVILYHCEETHGLKRKAKYLQEASLYCDKKVYVPNDLDSISLL